LETMDRKGGKTKEKSKKKRGDDGKRKDDSKKKDSEKRRDKEEREKKKKSGKKSVATREELFFGPPRIDKSEIRLIEKKGQGCFGTVWGGKCRGANVAVKIPNENRKISAEALEEFSREIELMSKIFSPNINLFMGACLDIGNVMIVTELMTGNVEQLLHSKTPLSLTTRMKMARDAAQGMAWLHGSNPAIIHRDLKSSNLLFTEKEGQYTIKVCDFGLSQLFSKGEMLRDADQVFGSPLWMAPEVMVRDEFNEKADVYSFGIVLWELLTRKPPFSHHYDLLTFRKAVCTVGERPPIPEGTIGSLSDLMQECWSGDPKVRSDFPHIVKALEGIIVDSAISDKKGRQFWKENFIDEDAVSNPRETIPWEEFAVLLYQFTESDPEPLPERPRDEQILGASSSQIKEFCSRGPEYFDVVVRTFEKHGQSIDDIEINSEKTMEHIEWKCLKEILAEEAKLKDGSELVRMEKFGDILAWFGPLRVTREGSLGKDNFLYNIRTIFEQGYFFGPLSGRAAISHLKDKPPGTFLVRFSSQQGWFAISTVSKEGQIAHYRIEHEPGTTTFRLEGSKGEAFKSLPDLLCAVANGVIFLEQPCPNSPFMHLFAQDKGEGDWAYSVAPFASLR